MLAQKSNQQTQKKERRDDDDYDFLTSGGPNQMIKVGHSRLTNPYLPGRENISGGGLLSARKLYPAGR